jgi:hypothetical protein
LVDVAVLLVRVAAARFDALVDVSDAPNTAAQTQLGVADRSVRGPAFLLLTARTRTLRRSGVQSVAVAVPVLAASKGANDAGAGPLGEAGLGEAGGAGIVHGLGVSSRQPDARSNWRMGSSLVSPETWRADSSTTSGLADEVQDLLPSD